MIDGHRVIALLLSGGAGTRLWPVSTDAVPKQFLKLFGQRSLYQRTVTRVDNAQVDGIVVLTNVAHEPSQCAGRRKAKVDARSDRLDTSWGVGEKSPRFQRPFGGRLGRRYHCAYPLRGTSPFKKRPPAK